MDEIEREQAELRKRFDELERSKQGLLIKEGTKGKEKKNVFKESSFERSRVMPYGIVQ